MEIQKTKLGYNKKEITKRANTIWSDDIMSPVKNKLQWTIKNEKQMKPRRPRATIRERQRMAQVNQAFDNLRRAVPRGHMTEYQRLSKIATLRLAIQYIRAMSHLLGKPMDNSLKLKQLNNCINKKKEYLSDELNIYTNQIPIKRREQLEHESNDSKYQNNLSRNTNDKNYHTGRTMRFRRNPNMESQDENNNEKNIIMNFNEQDKKYEESRTFLLFGCETQLLCDQIERPYINQDKTQQPNSDSVQYSDNTKRYSQSSSGLFDHRCQTVHSPQNQNRSTEFNHPKKPFLSQTQSIDIHPNDVFLNYYNYLENDNQNNVNHQYDYQQEYSSHHNSSLPDVSSLYDVNSTENMNKNHNLNWNVNSNLFCMCPNCQIYCMK